MLDLNSLFPKGHHPQPQPLKGDGWLVYGGRSCGKTSLAFQIAVNCVLDGGAVVVLCHESTMSVNMPRPFVPFDALAQPTLSRMELVYVDSWSAVLRELIILTRRADAVPPLILVDDGDFVLDGGAAGAGDRRRAHLSSGAASHVAAMAQCLSLLTGVADWLVRRVGRPFQFAVVTNSSAVAGGEDCAVGSSGGVLGLPFAAFPVVQIRVGAGGTVQIAPTATDRAESVRRNFTMRWDGGLKL